MWIEAVWYFLTQIIATGEKAGICTGLSPSALRFMSNHKPSQSSFKAKIWQWTFSNVIFFFRLCCQTCFMVTFVFCFSHFDATFPTLKCCLHFLRKLTAVFFCLFFLIPSCHFSLFSPQQSNICHRRLYWHSFFRVVRQPPRGAAKSSLRPKTSALTPWLPLSASSPSQRLSFQTFSNKQQVSTCDGRWFIWPGTAVTNIQPGGLQGGG